MAIASQQSSAIGRAPVFILGLLWLLLLADFLFILFTGSREGLANNLFGIVLASIPMVGGLFGLTLARKWGGVRSALGKSLIFLSLGLVSWSLGTFIFAGYYNILAQVEVPYPSLADIAYILSWPLWGIGVFFLSRATGAKYGLRSRTGKYFIFAAPLLAIAVSYYLLVVVARNGVLDFSDSDALKIFFDLAYPVGDVVILTLATLIFGLSLKFFGGVYRVAIYSILGSYVVMYFADFSFSFTTTLETWYPGNWVDLVFGCAVLLLTVGVVLLNPTFSRRVLEQKVK